MGPPSDGLEAKPDHLILPQVLLNDHGDMELDVARALRTASISACVTSEILPPVDDMHFLGHSHKVPHRCKGGVPTTDHRHLLSPIQWGIAGGAETHSPTDEFDFVGNVEATIFLSCAIEQGLGLNLVPPSKTVSKPPFTMEMDITSWPMTSATS